IDFQIAQALGRIVAAAEEAVAEQAEQRAGLTADAARLAFAIVGKVLPALMRGHGAAEVEALIAGCLDERPEEARLTVRLHPEMHDALKPRIAEMAAERGFEGKLVLLRDAALDFGDCRVEWADGGIERLVARVWADLDAATARALGAEPGLVAAMMAEPEPPAAADAPMETAAETAA
ncbi:MAG TPA: FliH/SctL family protein, partial [Alphaproteobacteria bacterium]|nr:FliH/SctL family protein [Alphaproteobacteria bacterium]